MTEIVTAADIYWLTRLDALNTVLAVASAVTLFVGICVSAIGASEDEPKVMRLGLCSLAFAALCGLALAFVPTTKEMCAILVIPKIANSQEVQGLGSEVVTLAREWLNELRPAK